MKRSTKFLIGLAAAALTYGSLLAFVGSRWKAPYARYGFQGDYQTHRGEYQPGCREGRKGCWNHQTHQPATNPADSLHR